MYGNTWPYIAPSNKKASWSEGLPCDQLCTIQLQHPCDFSETEFLETVLANIVTWMLQKGIVQNIK